MKLATAAAAACLLLCTSAGPVSGQRDPPQTQRLEGTVTNRQGEPLVGATVRVKNVENLMIRSFITTDEGRFHFANLTTAVGYEVWAEYRGNRSNMRRLSRFNTRELLEIRLVINVREEE